MAKQTILKERGTGEILYPLTLASCVQTAGGDNVDTALDKAGLALFIDMWVAAGGVYDTSAGFFGLNGITDIPYKEALAIYALRLNHRPSSMWGLYARQTTAERTLFPIPVSAESAVDCTSLFRYCASLKVIGFVNDYSASTQQPQVVQLRRADFMFDGCSALEKISGYLNLNNAEQMMFSGCVGLKDFTLLLGNVNLSLASSPLVSYASMSYLVSNAYNTGAITVTVHRDIYAKLTGDTTNAAAAALTADELAQWQQLLADANAKNISFATA